MSHAAPDKTAPDLLGLTGRRVLYALSILGAVAAPFVAVGAPEWAPAVVTATGVLTVAAGGAALANPSRVPRTSRRAK
ncbi:hypothetical protein [Microterricola viridarii]|uniref:Uncharacterized protein n=1 Tax=Microterricola viridarii TaxID=412690 RepID=A0A0X8E0R7_9MICO|nr:hypothetical protein [Microterricola viridarii]AMB58231.1 hypothetical protein AWU67_04510 [Microterricola viridarii]